VKPVLENQYPNMYEEVRNRMVLDVYTILKLLRENIRRTGLPVPADKDVLYRWSQNMGLTERTGVLLYTGGLYQLLPYIEAFSLQLEKMEKSGLGKIAFKADGRLSRLAGLAGIVVHPKRESVEKSDRILQGIVRLLRAVDVNVYYDPKLDGYSGVLLYDMGLDDDFAAHAQREAEKLQSSGAELIITVDPHTTHVLRKVYPKFFDWFDIPVKSYLEILAEHIDELNFKNPAEGVEVVLHDPCYYARFENIIEEPRLLLEKAGYKVVNPRRWGRKTYCCGGPIESIAPSLSKRIAENRIIELSETGARIAVVLCPICYANLSKVAGKTGVTLEDISILLSRALGEW
jgi:Fe-S oxidoreductase